MKKIIIIIVTLFSLKSFSCDLGESNKNNTIKSWIGNNSSFSKSFTKGKCALDEALNNLPASEKKVIANLIAKSYSFEVNRIKKLKTYNY